ncbi:UDP-glucose 4-epimerase GalE [Kluyvera sichuanensis]|uniref:UDP-glucose 4-epimerase GalE n=1 Tax=Kluyvera sichuanensis TaxID=2725494 RepID=UPI0039F708C8
MRILVTGGAGYIGSHTCLVLLEHGFDVSVLDNFSNSSEESLRRVCSISGKEIKIYRGDIRDKNTIDYILSKDRYDSVIHFAGLKSVSESVTKPLSYYDVNFNGTLVLLDAMYRHNVCDFIFSSSATVYGEPVRLPLDEQCPTGGSTNPYGASKYFTEEMLKSFSSAHPSFHITILRYFNPIGAHESGLLGESPNGIPNNLLPYLTNVAIGKLDELKVYGGNYNTPDGTGVRDYIHVMDLADGHLAAVLSGRTSGCDIYNLGTGKGYSVFDVINEFEYITGTSLKYRVVERRAGDVGAVWSDPTLAKNKLKWEAKRDLRKMISDAWRWQVNNPLGYN